MNRFGRLHAALSDKSPVYTAALKCDAPVANHGIG